jgi:hypothetical protein
MTSLAPSPTMVALVQAATTLPVFMLALPAGAFCRYCRSPPAYCSSASLACARCDIRTTSLA